MAERICNTFCLSGLVATFFQLVATFFGCVFVKILRTFPLHYSLSLESN